MSGKPVATSGSEANASGSALTLSRDQSRVLGQTAQSKRDLHAPHHEEHGHGHHEKAPSILTAFAAAVINFLLMFGLCCAYGMIMFEDDWNAQHRGMAVKMNLATALLCGLLLSAMSKVPVAIGGPDLNPVVFLSMFIGKIAESLAKQHGLVYPAKEGRRLVEECSVFDYDPVAFIRRLGASSSAEVDFCTGDHLISHLDDCANYHAELRATTVFTVALSSAILGLLFFGLGRYKLTRFVTYVPTNIMEAFLSCVGYKVFKYALKFCKYEPKQFIPAACVGVPLYFVKALHIGNPAVVIPIMLGVPLGIFYMVLFASGGDVASARQEGWFFGEIENAEFYGVYQAALNVASDTGGGFGGNINLTAWAATLGDLPIMIIVCLLDCLLKLSSTESKLPVKADKDYEIQVYGAGNLLTFLTGSSVGYMQLKFNVINYGVMGNVSDRRGGVLYALFCGVCFFWTTDLFNYLPRFFLSTLLFFAGSGFVAENLWGSRKYLSIGEWLQIFVILGVFIFVGSLLYAVIVGGLLTGASFILRYAKIPSVQGHPLKGHEVVPVERTSFLMQCNIRSISKQNLMVVKLKGFVFFASAQTVTAWLTAHIEEQSEIAGYKRVQWLVFDCEYLDGLDSSASKSVAKLSNALKAMDVTLLWSGMSEQFLEQMKKCGTITSEREYFTNLDEAVAFTDHQIAERVTQSLKRWESLHPMFDHAHRLACNRDRYDPFARILPKDVQRFGCPWKYCERIEIKAYETLLWRPGMENGDLFLVQSGKVALFDNIRDGKGAWPPPSAIYTHGWFLNRQALMHGLTRGYAVALESGQLLFWNRAQWSKMSRERPYMAEAIMHIVLQQEAEDRAMLERDKKQNRTTVGDDSETCNGGSVDEERMIEADDTKRQMQRLSIAQAMDELGFFESPQEPDEFPLPQLPGCISADIKIAFKTYAAVEESNVEVPTIPATEVDHALRYAGIHNVALRPIQKQYVTLSEFNSISVRGLLSPLSNAVAAKLQASFLELKQKQVDVDGKTVVDRDELTSLFNKIFQCDIPEDLIDGIASCWDGQTGQISETVFIAVVARFVRHFTYEFCVLRGLRDVMGTTTLQQGDVITKQMIINANPKISPEEAEEMIWCANPASASSDGSSLDYRHVASILSNPTDEPRPLPPKPVFVDPEMKLPSWDVVPTATAWTRNIVLDFRDPDKQYEIQLSGRIQEPKEETDMSTFYSEEEKVEVVIPDTWKAKLFLFMDDPMSSKPANLMSIFMGIMILISVLTLFCEPLISPPDKNAISQTEKDVWFGFEVFFTALFTVEFLVTFAVCDGLGTMTHAQFLKDPMRICDIVAVLPFYVDQTIDTDQEEFRLFRIARLMRLSRIVRLGRLSSKSATFAPIAMILVVIWGIYMKNGLKE